LIRFESSANTYFNFQNQELNRMEFTNFNHESHNFTTIGHQAFKNLDHLTFSDHFQVFDRILKPVSIKEQCFYRLTYLLLIKSKSIFEECSMGMTEKRFLTKELD